MTSQSRPIVGIPACFRDWAGARFHMIADEYIAAVLDRVGAIPLVIPAVADALDIDALLGGLDGILVTGSPSNVDPARYGGPASDPGTLHDPRRDETDLRLIPAAIRAGTPLLAICRGFQEMNVAYGGTLHQKLHELPGRLDHRAPISADPDIQYAAAHSVFLPEDGMLRSLLGTENTTVNSLHWQGVDRLGDGLVVDAVAEDGTIEAFHVAAARNFSLAVQWHPEHRPAENAVSRAIFGAFADAVHARRNRSSAAA